VQKSLESEFAVVFNAKTLETIAVVLNTKEPPTDV
jgi:hypothetical protein